MRGGQAGREARGPWAAGLGDGGRPRATQGGGLQRLEGARTASRRNTALRLHVRLLTPRTVSRWLSGLALTDFGVICHSSSWRAATQAWPGRVPRSGAMSAMATGLAGSPSPAYGRHPQRHMDLRAQFRGTRHAHAAEPPSPPSVSGTSLLPTRRL